MISTLRTAGAILTFFAVVLANAHQDKIQVQVDGNAVAFPYAQPQYVNGRVLVPVRGVFEQMGAIVSWNPQSRLVTATKEETTVHLRIGERFGTVNGSEVSLDVPAVIINGSTMVPVRFISEALGAKVGWIQAESLVTIDTGIASDQIVTDPKQLRRVVVRQDEVIPVTLDGTLSSVDNARAIRSPRPFAPEMTTTTASYLSARRCRATSQQCTREMATARPSSTWHLTGCSLRPVRRSASMERSRHLTASTW